MKAVFAHVFAVALLSSTYADSNSGNNCVLPPIPAYGKYEVKGVETPDLSKAYEHLTLNYSCTDGNTIIGERVRLCVKGVWSGDEPKCIQCGIITPNQVSLRRRRSTSSQEVPWHAGVYKKTVQPYRQLCGGTLVSQKVVLSAGHCFWDISNKNAVPENYAVAVGKTHRRWDAIEDTHAQKSDVSEIKTPSRFQGALTNFQDDIAILILATNIVYGPAVRPVCLNFDPIFEKRQLQEKQLGKIAGWGLTGANGKPAEVLKVVELPYVPITECLVSSPPSFRQFISSDKICAGFFNGTAMCKGDSGGGISFPEQEQGVKRFYLRGVMSISPIDDNNLCSVNWLNTFTQVSKHEHFIRVYSGVALSVFL